MSSALILGAREWMLAATAMAIGLSIVVGWSYLARGSQSFWSNAIALLAKCVAVIALAFCLLEPMRRSERPRPGANVMAVLADNSRSMMIRPPGEQSDYPERFKAALSKDAPWQTRMAQDFEVRRYSFDQRLKAVEDLAELAFDGNHSALADALTTLQSRFATRPVAGAILFSDGLATDDLAKLESTDLSFPVFPVANTEEMILKDLALGEPSVAMSSFELAPATIEANVHGVGLEGRQLVVRLYDGEGKTVDKQSLTCDQSKFEKRVRFQYQPKSPGLQFVRLRVALAEEDVDSVQFKSQQEVTTANNSRLVTVDRGGGPFRILYVAGRPNWEFKFLRRALEEDVEFELKALIRMANKEPKFVFGDREVDATNPLFSGFAEDSETTERYDEPVLIRIGVEDGVELKGGFPKTEEVLYQYHAVILDDLDAKFFSQSQMLLLRQFVAERGGGLLMLGGQEMFLSGDYQETPLGDVLPVYLRGKEESKDKENAVRYRLTREGGLEPWLRLRANEMEEKTRVQEMPEFQTWNTIEGVKPGASVLAQLSSDQPMIQPGLVVQRFGKGRAAALLVGDMWRWSLRRANEQTDDLAQSWRQIARWLTADVPRDIEVDVQSPASSSGPHRIAIQVRDPAFKPLDNATVTLVVSQPDNQKIELTATPDRTRQGQYLAEFFSQQDGPYRCQVDVTGPTGDLIGKLQCGWTALPSSNEFARVQPDLERLKEIARRSGGELIGLNQLDRLASDFPASKVPITESHIEPLWHRPWLLLLALGCLCLEWGLRRVRGLP